MKRKSILCLAVVFGLFIFLCGCETTKSCSAGGSAYADSTKETGGLWGEILKLDQWMKDNMW